MNKVTRYPFNNPPLIQALVTREELLTMLRGRINKDYMRSATGEVQCNSKPEYLRSSNLQNFFSKIINSRYSGFFRWSDVYDIPVGPIYAALHFKDWTVTADLSNDAIVVLDNINGAAWQWTGDVTMSIDRSELATQIELL